MGFVVTRVNKYSERLVIPKALRPFLGRNEFKQPLGTSNKTEAELSTATLILHSKKLIEDSKTDGVIPKAEAPKRVLNNSPNNDLLSEDGAQASTKTGIIEDTIEDIILGRSNIGRIDNKEVRAKTKIVFDIALSQVTTPDDLYLDSHLGSRRQESLRNLWSMD